MKRSSTPGLVVAFSALAFLVVSVSTRESQAGPVGETETQNPTNTYDAGHHDGAQAATQATIGQAQAAAAATVPTTTDEEESSGGCS